VAGGARLRTPFETELKIGIMKHWIACLSFLALLATTGCDTVTHTQIHVLAPKPPTRSAKATVPAVERDTVKRILTDIATRLRYEDRTAISITPNTICSYAQPDVKHPISIKAWTAGDRIAIDIFQRPPSVGETIAYQKLRDDVMAQLKEHFGDRLKLVHKMDQTGSRAGEKG
jgi:hypothetical protein